MQRRVNGNHGNGFAQFYFSKPLWVRSLFFAALVWVIEMTLDVAVHYIITIPAHWEWWHERIFENSLESFVIACIVFWLSLLREQRLARRMKEIGYLNHHIRNALEAIALAAYQIKESKEVYTIVYDGVRRITETLAKVQRAEDVPSKELDEFKEP